MSLGPQFSQYYQLNDRISKGSFSTIYSCTKRGTGDVFVVRIVDRTVLSPAQLIRLEDEIALLQAVKHERVVAFVERFDSPNSTYIVLEAVSGGTLLDGVAYSAVYNESVALNIVYNILLALQNFHHNNIVHRNLSLESLLVRLRVPGDIPSTVDPATLAVLFKQRDQFAVLPGDVMIGGTTFAAAVPPEGLTTCCGSPQYMAPEMLDAWLSEDPNATLHDQRPAPDDNVTRSAIRRTPTRRSYGVEVDMWSVGVATHVLLAGYAPFRGRTLRQLFCRIRTAPVVFATSPRSVWCSISDVARDFISRLLTRDPHSRMTVDEAIRHPWLATRSSLQKESVPLSQTQFNLQIFAARAAFPSGVFGIESDARRAYLAHCRHLGVRPNSGVTSLLEEAFVSRADRGEVLHLESSADESRPALVYASGSGAAGRVPGRVVNLNFDNNLLRGRSLVAVAALIADKHDIESISLVGQQLNGEGVAALCRALLRHPGVRSLNLSNNFVGYQGAKRLLDLVVSNRGVHYVGLEACNVHPAKIAAIAEAASVNASTYLTIGARAIAAMGEHGGPMQDLKGPLLTPYSSRGYDPEGSPSPAATPA